MVPVELAQRRHTVNATMSTQVSLADTLNSPFSLRASPYLPPFDSPSGTWLGALDTTPWTQIYTITGSE